MNVEDILNKYYTEENALKHILLTHSQSVAQKCLQIAKAHPELQLDETFLYEAAMLHDIGIFKTNAPGIQCFGTYPYICHGLLGGELMRAEGYPRHARVCERHTGTGLSKRTIEEQDLPLPHEDFLPETPEEQVICFADKFYSKTHLERERTPKQVEKSLEKFGHESVKRFHKWKKLFL